MKWAVAAIGIVLVAGALTSVQPLSPPWWAGGDFYSVYTRAGLGLLGGYRSDFVDHPGTPVQNAAGIMFTADWVASGASESRTRRATEWTADLDTTRAPMRTLAALFLALSAVSAGLVVGALLGGAGWAFLAGVLFLAAPGLLTQALAHP